MSENLSLVKIKSKYIEGFDKKYKIYSEGKIKDKINDEYKISYYDKSKKYYFITLINSEGIRKKLKMINLMYQHFVNIIPKGMKVGHIDDIKTNFNKNNLFLKEKSDKRTYKEIYETDMSAYGKPIPDYPDYLMKNDGEVYSLKAKIFMITDSKNKEYKHVGLSKNGIYKTFLVHRLVYEIYKGELEEGKVIDHINRNKKDNHIDNLRQVNPKINAENISPQKNKVKQNFCYLRGFLDENNKFIANKTFKKEEKLFKKYKERGLNSIRECCNHTDKKYLNYYWRYMENENRIIDLTGFFNIETHDGNTFENNKYMSNKEGIIINKFGKILSQILNDGYFYLGLYNDNFIKKKYSVHRILALTFIPNPLELKIVNHKDEKKWNNIVSNLEWMTTKQNTIHSLGVKICQMSIKSGKIKHIFKSYTEINEIFAKELGLKCIKKCIRKSCENKIINYDFFWKFYEDGDEVGKKINIEVYKEIELNNSIKICQISIKSGKIKYMYNSYTELNEIFAVKLDKKNIYYSIRKACKNKTIKYEYYWKIREEGDKIGKLINLDNFIEEIKIIQINPKTKKIINIYKSYVELNKLFASKLGFADISYSISKACEKKSLKYEYYWKLKEKDDKIGKSIDLDDFEEEITKEIKICQIDPKTKKIIKIYKSYKEVNKLFGSELGFANISKTIRKACNEESIKYGFYWKTYENGDVIGKKIKI